MATRSLGSGALFFLIVFFATRGFIVRAVSDVADAFLRADGLFFSGFFFPPWSYQVCACSFRFCVQMMIACI
jgi:hypothetical protein